MAEKYSCPKCGKELSEAEIIRGICSNCHKVFDSLPQNEAIDTKQQSAKVNDTSLDTNKSSQSIQKERVDESLFYLFFVGLFVWIFIFAFILDELALEAIFSNFELHALFWSIIIVMISLAT